MQLGGPQADAVHRFDHSSLTSVTKHSDSHDVWRKLAHDVAHNPLRHLALRRGEDEPEGVGTQGGGQERILDAGNAADLDEHGRIIPHSGADRKPP